MLPASLIPDRNSCIHSNYTWLRPFWHFDHVGASYLSLFGAVSYLYILSRVSFYDYYVHVRHATSQSAILLYRVIISDDVHVHVCMVDVGYSEIQNEHLPKAVIRSMN